MFDKVTQSGISTQRVGVANMQGLTLMGSDEPEYHIPPEAEAGNDSVTKGNPAMILVGLILILVMFWLIRQNSAVLQKEALGLNLFNVLTIAITAIVGITLFKFLFSRFPVPGVTPLVAAV
jgi:hypothetical protein